MEENKKYFINPYNFVRNSQKSPDRNKDNDSKNFTGYIEASLAVKTPLSIPGNLLRECENGHKVYDFFKVNGVPTIPGSELRGMVRHAFETITSSCYSVVGSDILTKRDNKALSPGILQYDKEWSLYGATMSGGGEPAGSDDIVRQWYTVGKYGTRRKEFIMKKGVKVCIDSDTLSGALKYYQIVLDIYKKNAGEDNIMQKCYGGVELKVDGTPIPVFYKKEENGRLILAPAQITRKVFRASIKTLLGDYYSCSDKQSPCPACRLFGNISSKAATASRVRFGDATLINPLDEIKLRRFTLKELSAPKTTSVEFYSTKENYPKWDYDDSGVKLRGRKFYYHNKRAVSDDSVYSDDKQTQRNGTFELLMPSQDANKPVLFKFKIYFNNISEKELRQLAIAVNFGENDGGLMHKLGHGKPLGLGSVKVTIDSVKVRNVYMCNELPRYIISEYSDVQFNYAEAENPLRKNDNTLIAMDKEAVCDMLNLVNFDFINEKHYTIAYPMGDRGSSGENAKAGHQWFSWNRGGGSIGFSRFERVLPKASESAKDQLLPVVTSDMFVCRQGTKPNRRYDTQNSNTRQVTGGYSTEQLRCPVCGLMFDRGRYRGSASNFECFKCSKDRSNR